MKYVARVWEIRRYEVECEVEAETEEEARVLASNGETESEETLVLEGVEQRTVISIEEESEVYGDDEGPGRDRHIAHDPDGLRFE